MFRKLLLSGLVAMGLSAGMPGLMENSAQAHDDHDFGRGGRRDDRRGDRDFGRDFGRDGRNFGHIHFKVLYRQPYGRMGWRVYGEFHNEFEARRAERMLENRGLIARIERDRV